jgi:60 kDa SS-A/Ro ribonucleoprotein
MKDSNVCGCKTLNSIEACMALALVLKKSDPINVDIMGFSDDFIPLPISHLRRLDDNLRSITNLPFSLTDISLPFTWAQSNEYEYDAFLVLTDNETNCNTINPMQAFRMYRKQMNKPECKFVVLATCGSRYTVADPNDNHTLNVSGFDSNVLHLITDFITGCV